MTPLWSGRFDTAPDAAAFEFGASFRFDRRLFEDDVTGSVAWARALGRAGVIVGDDARRIEAALAEILERGRSDPAFVDGPDEDVHSFVERLLVERLGDAGDEADALPLGSGAIAGTSYKIDVHQLARDLGFSRIVANSIDASSDRDFASTFLYACALTMVHLSRLAEDLIVFCSDEYRFFDLSDALSTGSSMMPQKKNPDPLELVRGKAGRTVGQLTALLTTLKGLPSGYNKDLQEDKEAIFDAEDTVLGSLAVVRLVVDGLTLNRQRAEAAASG